MFAARIAKTGKWMQTPSMLIVAPSGSAKPESSLRICSSSSATRSETGRAAALDRVRNAVRTGSLTAASTRYGFSRQITSTNSG